MSILAILGVAWPIISGIVNVLLSSNDGHAANVMRAWGFDPMVGLSALGKLLSGKPVDSA